jgi:hypothetical protein
MTEYPYILFNKVAVAAEPTASRRQSGRAGRNAASGRNVGQVCANGAATKLLYWFSWAALTKCRCSVIVLGGGKYALRKAVNPVNGAQKDKRNGP